MIFENSLECKARPGTSPDRGFWVCCIVFYVHFRQLRDRDVFLEWLRSLLSKYDRGVDGFGDEITHRSGVQR